MNSNVSRKDKSGEALGPYRCLRHGMSGWLDGWSTAEHQPPGRGGVTTTSSARRPGVAAPGWVRQRADGSRWRPQSTICWTYLLDWSVRADMTTGTAPRLGAMPLAAVQHVGSHMQIIASAGSGKAEAVAHRVADLIATGVDPAGSSRSRSPSVPQLSSKRASPVARPGTTPP
jgi:UvrD-like helicase family protein